MRPMHPVKKQPDETRPFEPYLILFALVLLVLLAVGNGCDTPLPDMPDGGEADAAVRFTLLEEPLDIDAWKMTQHVDAMALTRAQLHELTTIGLLAEGIYNTRTAKDTQPYWFCGDVYEGEEARDLATSVAYHVVKSAAEASDERWTVNPWGWAGLLNNESKLDLCTLGLIPRHTAYAMGILKRRKRTISHSRQEITDVIRHPKMKTQFRAYDLGMAQTLDSHYRSWLRREEKEGKPADLISWGGLYWQATYLHSLAVRFQTDRPWTYWPGYKAPWKDCRVTKHARKLGAPHEELDPAVTNDCTRPDMSRIREKLTIVSKGLKPRRTLP